MLASEKCFNGVELALEKLFSVEVFKDVEAKDIEKYLTRVFVGVHEG